MINNRPSKLDMRIACIASAIFEKEFPDNSTSLVAEKGTKLHHLLETGETPDDLDSDELWNLETARWQIDKLIADLEESTGEKVHVHKELKVDISIGFDPFTKGTADLVLMTSKMIVVIDYKSGRVKVDKASFQLQAYALGIAQKYGSKGCKVVIGVCQPTCYKKIEMMSFDEVYAVDSFTKLLVDQSETPYSFATGDHCKYCNYRTQCPARNHKNEILLQRTREISVAQVPEFLKNYSLLNKLLKDSYEKAKGYVREGLVQDYEIELTKGNRKVDDINGLFGEWKEYFTPDEFMSFCSLSITKFVNEAKRRLKNIEDIKTLKESELRVKKSMEEYVTHSKPSEKIVNKSIK